MYRHRRGSGIGLSAADGNRIREFGNDNFTLFGNHAQIARPHLKLRVGVARPFVIVQLFRTASVGRNA